MKRWKKNLIVLLVLSMPIILGLIKVALDWQVNKQFYPVHTLKGTFEGYFNSDLVVIYIPLIFIIAIFYLGSECEGVPTELDVKEYRAKHKVSNERIKFDEMFGDLTIEERRRKLLAGKYDVGYDYRGDLRIKKLRKFDVIEYPAEEYREPVRHGLVISSNESINDETQPYLLILEWEFWNERDMDGKLMLVYKNDVEYGNNLKENKGVKDGFRRQVNLSQKTIDRVQNYLNTTLSKEYEHMKL